MPSIWIDKLLKPLYDYEVTHLHYFQSTFQDNEEFLINASIWGDPSKAFYIIFPILLAFHQSTAVNYLGSVIACEWINQVLKWILHGHRPYWYVKQNDLLQLNQFGLKQSPITCETGPGLPSGHVMVNVVTGLTIVNFLISCARDSGLSNPVTLVLRRVLWNGFFVFIATVMASRIYILAHFPHQCVVALIFGYLSCQFSVKRIGKLKKICLAVFCLLSALTIYFKAEFFLGFDINWSLQLAHRHCQKKEWIYVDTTPLYAMVRYSGSALGLALISTNFENRPRSFPKIALALLCFISIGLASHWIHQNLISKDDMILFYLYEYFLNAFTVFFLLQLSNRF